MRLLFLDCDGVLNHEAYFRQLNEQNGKCNVDPVDPACMARLNTIVKRTGCKIVISSTWRLNSRRPVSKYLAEQGLDGVFLTEEGTRYPPTMESVIIDTTGTSRSGVRGIEIMDWLEWYKRTGEGQKNPVTDFVILDDSEDMLQLGRYLVRTSCGDGLTQEKMEETIRMLGGQC